MLPGETIASGASPRCEERDRLPKLDVYLSGAGYYRCFAPFGGEGHRGRSMTIPEQHR